MRRHVIGLVSMAVGTLGIFLGACSSSNSGTGTASTSSEFVDQYCTYYAACCGAENYPSDGKQCRSFAALAGGGTYDPQAGNACLSTLQSVSQKDPTWCVDDTAETNKACDPAFGKNSGGSVQPGGTCQTDSDCAAAPQGDEVSCRDYFSSTGGASTRICQVWTHGKAGDSPCIGTQTVTSSGITETSFYDDLTDDGGTHPSQGIICYTSDGVTCEQQNGAYTCVALGQVGDACQSTGSSGCVPTAYCDSSDKCVARIATGQSCTSTQACVAGDYCDTSGSGNCTAQLASGASCTTSQQCQSDDCTNGKCGAGLASIGLSFLCGSPTSSGDAGK